MNILFIHTNGIIPTTGGISRTTANLGELLRNHDHQVWYVGVSNLDPEANYDKNQLFLPWSPAYNENNVLYLCQVISRYDIHIIINQSPLSLPIVNLLNRCAQEKTVKIISCFHNSILTPVIRYAYCQEYRLKQHHLGLLFHFLRWKPVSDLIITLYIAKWRRSFQQIVEKSDALVLLCEGQVKELLRMCGISQCGKVHIIPNCIPNTQVVTNTKKDSVVWTGTFDYSIKRPDFMLKIWQRVSGNHPNWILYMIGDGPSLFSMKRLSKQLSLSNVVFTGRIKPDDYYKSSKIQCVTSIHESFSLVSVEAMASGNPVIAFNSFTAAPLVVKNEASGYLIKPFDLNSYAIRLSHLMDDAQLCQNMGKQAKESVSRFSEDKVYSMWALLFDKL